MQDEIAQVFAKLVEIDSPSLGEHRMAEQIKELFGNLGIQLTEDSSSEVTGSDSGNLYAYVPEQMQLHHWSRDGLMRIPPQISGPSRAETASTSYRRSVS